MRITESKLRSIIRSVIRESIDDKIKKNIEPLRAALKATYPPSKFSVDVTDKNIREFLKAYFNQPLLRNEEEIGSDATSKFADFVSGLKK